MGWQDWLWSPRSTTADSTQSPSLPTSHLPSSPSSANQTQHPSSSSQPKASPPPTLSRDEAAEAEFRDLLRELDQPPAALNPTADSPSPRQNPGLARRLKFARSTDPLQRHHPSVNPDDIHPMALLPREMSCRAAFDQAFYCQSLGGQFVNLYRYGGVRNCSELWSNFWFCMRTSRGGLAEEEKESRIRAHYWERMEKYRSGLSSEDVWEVRTKKIESPFDADYETWEKEQRERGT